MNYIIFHPVSERFCTEINGIGKVYHDSFKGNQDPYVWNEPFLHSFCKITQIKKEIGQYNFWVSSEIYPNFEHLYCDLVFKVASMHEWKDRNSISVNDSIVDSKQSFIHHYKKGVMQHPFKGETRPKKRVTLKACKENSFQPQNEKQELIDIVPFLLKQGYSLEDLRKNISFYASGKMARTSKPMILSDKMSKALFDYLSSADIKIYAKDLKNKYPKK
ncbi:hypothetical protein N9E20_00780 [Crocinitomicaceae bacterium]|nr:hypothetical protein [Crocinitomicaceae bacterium]